MEVDRKRKIEQLIDYYQERLAAKRRKLDNLTNELRCLEYDPTKPIQSETTFQIAPEHCSTPISRKPGYALAKGAQSPMPDLDLSALGGKKFTKLPFGL